LTFNLPNSVVLLTTLGLFVYEFAADLTNTSSIIEYGLIPSSRRQILLSYSRYGKAMVRNPYGAAFLVQNRYTLPQAELYQTKLVGISYYSSLASLVFKVIDIVDLGSKDQCGNLNQNSYFELTPEDQLAVTFICNQYLYVYRVCMRPHIIVSLDDSTMVKEASIVIEGKNRFDDGFMPSVNATI
jgi:hypothetical protein